MKLLSRRHGASSRLLAIVGLAVIVLAFSSYINVKADSKEEKNIVQTSENDLNLDFENRHANNFVAGVQQRNLQAKKKNKGKKGKKSGKGENNKKTKKAKKGKATKTQKKKSAKTEQAPKATKSEKQQKGKKTGKPKASRNPFKRIAKWFKSHRKRESVKVSPKTTVVKTVKTEKPEGDLGSKRPESKTAQSAVTSELPSPSSAATEQEGGTVVAQEAEEAKESIDEEKKAEAGVGQEENLTTMNVETKVHDTFVPEAGTETEVSAFIEPYFEEDETQRDVNDLTPKKEEKLLAMLTEAALENANPELEAALASIRVLKYAKTARHDCPDVTTSTSYCSARCGPGERYRFRLLWDAQEQTCKKETLVQECVVVSGCKDSSEKMQILQITKPDYVSVGAFDELAQLLPPESLWQRNMTSEGFVFYSFRTALSSRYCPFSGDQLSDHECGIAYRYYYTQFLDKTENGLVARGGIDREVDIVDCLDNQLNGRQRNAVLEHFLEDYMEEVDEAGSIAPALTELQIIEFQANELHPMCPSVATNQSSCSSNGCGPGRRYSLTSMYSPVTEVCQTLRQEPCLVVSGCTEELKKFELLDVEKPKRLPESVFIALAKMIPHENEWEKIRTQKGNVLRVGFGLSTEWSGRFSPDGVAMSDDECGPAHRWKYTREYSEEEDSILQDFLMMDATVICDGVNKPYSVSEHFDTLESNNATLVAPVHEERVISDFHGDRNGDDNTEDNADGDALVNNFEGKANVNFEGNTDASFEGNTDVNFEGNTDVNFEGNTDVNFEGNNDVNFEDNTDVNFEDNTDVNFESNADVNFEGNTDVNLEGNADVNIEGSSDVNTDDNSNINVDSNAEDRIETEADVQLEEDEEENVPNADREKAGIEEEAQDFTQEN